MNRRRRRSPLLPLLLSAVLLASTRADPLRTAQILNESGLSGNQDKPTEPRQHVIRRLYGPENAKARRNVAELEERSMRSQTGFRGDPNHIIEYENHPFDKTRRLQEDTNSSLYKPMRICFDTTTLESQRSSDNAARIDFVENEILPRMKDFWEKALSVVPISGNLLISAQELENRMYCGDSEFTTVPDDHISNGIPDCDVMLYVSGTPSTRYCDTSTLAVAVACNFDQYDRPIAGSINFCLDTILIRDDGTASAAVIQDNVDVAIHEAAHVFGMSSNSYRFFWDPDTGEPRTERPFSAQTVTCVDEVTRTLIVPDENTMKFFVAENGKRYASIVTPKVRTVARNQFDCQSIAGAQLENQLSGSNSCTGDHWDERLFYPEALTAVISPTTNVLSPLTLALFEDSGWYKANFTMARASPWGLGAGCDFVTDACLTPGSVPTVPEYSRGYFCNTPSYKGCSSELTHKVACTVIDYQYRSTPPPDTEFQYFTDEPTRGGPEQADYCPVFGSIYQGEEDGQFDCQDAAQVPSVNLYNEVYGEDSMCFETDGGEGRCFRAACVKDEMALKINVRGEWFTCEYDFMEFEVRLASGTIPTMVTCPRLSAACPDLFCPFNCAGRGTCNFANVDENNIIRPKCECFDESDISEGCSESQIPDGKFLDDSSGLKDDIEEGFFDPLVAVFVDHPNKWTTASWAWAGGLIALFVVMLLCIASSFWPQGQRRKEVSLPEC